MINSDNRKLTIAGWLQKNDLASYSIPLKLQKFIFFYECACKFKGYSYDFSNLKGYKNGPVFSPVWGDYTKERNEFDIAACEQYEINQKTYIFSEIVQKIDFLVKTCNEIELSRLTHTMNIWKCKRHRIMSNEYQVPLSEDDFNSDDKKLIGSILSTYSEEMIKNSKVIQVRDTIFLLSKNDANNLSPEQWDTLQELANSKDLDLENPVYISMDPEKKGRLLVD